MNVRPHPVGLPQGSNPIKPTCRTKAPLDFIPLHATFGAECRGVDFSQPVPEETINDIRIGMAKFGVLVFRRTALDDARHVEFARQFGELDVSGNTYTSGKDGRHRLAPHNELVDVSNIDPNGQVESADSIQSLILKGNNLFHVDCSYNHRRAGYSILRAHQLPPKGTGGGTEFADTRTAYEDLDNETKERIKDYVITHSLMHSRRLGAPEYAILKWLRIYDFPTNQHKLVQLHEPSGRTNLYIAAHAYCINDQSAKDSQPAINELFQHASQQKYTFTVDWMDGGDVVMWDNTCVMHRGCGGSFQGKYIRDMRRATVYDASSSAWGVLGKNKPPDRGIRWTSLLSSFGMYLRSYFR